MIHTEHATKGNGAFAALAAIGLLIILVMAGVLLFASDSETTPPEAVVAAYELTGYILETGDHDFVLMTRGLPVNGAPADPNARWHWKVAYADGMPVESEFGEHVADLLQVGAMVTVISREDLTVQSANDVRTVMAERITVHSVPNIQVATE